ncbi:hypothetical protein CAPTEDRAFT_214693 [Capitella teleta]|uniref:Uncharacterized protein n=1 Tax=Capitella teleta TaxID=283909 RepID=R7VKU0_CAPTE|nr:hypothetical protein CAPTEDRAFT_214693 [Capitella teleta]|eukprot:ELU17060.1 hypothetical protein CAPTEDRAFT_214693 [Capitella teleta]
MDGVVVLNTGDSLVALSVDIEDNHGGFGFHLYSPRVTRSESTMSSISSTISDEQEERLFSDVELTEPLLLVHSPHFSRATPKDTTNVGGVNLDFRPASAVRERHASTGKENLNFSKLGGSPVAGETSTAVTARPHRSLDVYNFEGSTPKKEEDSDADSPKAASYRGTLSFASFQRGAQMSNGAEGEIVLPSESQETVSEERDLFEKPSGLPRSLLSTQRAFTANLSLVPPDGFSMKGVAFSPGYNKLDTASSTCSSCVSSPLILQSESQCFTYSVRRYVESFGQVRPDSPIDIEGN